MDNVIFEDDMQEFKQLSWILLAVSFLAGAAFTANVCVYGVTQDNIVSIIAVGVVVIFLICFSVYFALYTAKYNVKVINNNIFVSSIFVKKSIELTDATIFERKKYNSKYDIFYITVGSNKLTVRTKKSNELIEILRQFTSDSHN